MPYRFVLVTVASLVVACLDVANAQDGEPIGEVANLSGPAVVLRDGEPESLYRGADVYRGDHVRTLEATKLRIAFADGSKLVLGARSKVAIRRHAPAEGRGTLELLRGILRAVLPDTSDWNRYDVESRNAVASVRSTEWVVVLGSEQTSVFVVDGTVGVRASETEVQLQSGDGTDVPFGDPPGAPVQWGQARVDRVLNQTTLR